MKPSSLARLLIAIGLAVVVAGCTSTKNNTIVPDTQPGEQLLDAYLYGDWCTNREETSNANREIGVSALVNVSPVFWRFQQNGDWETSSSGFIFERHGSWKLENPDKLLLAKNGMSPQTYRAQFKNGGADLFLIDSKDQFMVIAHCD